ncbi:MAG: M55 family metallopeptidase, partial [Candidatus Bathyarchaeota archaeon]|nr:M55 family metallopeptidase [Candidatus Bathyarchaeota archaeon]
SHSFYPFPKNIWVDNLKIGEIALNMASFGAKGVPTVLITGDLTAVEEAKALVSDIQGATVKWALAEKEKLGALSVRKAISLSPQKAQSVIKDAARKAMDKIGKIKPLVIPTPFTLKVEYIEAKYMEGIARSPGVTRLDDVTITKKCNTIDDIVF